MKKSILLYLFILAVLFNVFTYMYYSKKSDAEQLQFKTADARFQKKIDSLKVQLSDANYFALETNQNAQDYLADSNANIEFDKFIPAVIEKLKEFNDNPNGNPYVGFDKMGEQKFIINKAKILNHRWIIADFSNGTQWGEVILKYFINEDGTVSFETAETFLYTK